MSTRKAVNRLTGKQRIWLEHYLTHWNATRAAEEAGFSRPSVDGSRTKNNPRVQEALQDEMSNLIMTREEAMMRLSEQARNGATAYVNAFGELEIDRMINDKKTHLLKELQPFPRFHDAQAALVHILRQYQTQETESDLTSALSNALDEISRETAVTL